MTDTQQRHSDAAGTGGPCPRRSLMQAPAHRPSRWQAPLRIALVIALLYALHEGSGLLLDRLDVTGLGWHTGVIAALIYAFTLSVPFVPGVEIGLGLMAMLGPQGAVMVYLGTLLGLSIAFAAGCWIPVRTLVKVARWLHLHRLTRSLRHLAHNGSEGAMRQLNALAPKRLAHHCYRHRYLLLVLIINLPGNALIGGGGGIALLAGLSKQFRYPVFLLACAVAAAPVPLLFLLRGSP